VPRSGEWLLLSADYSQIELRILAHVTKDGAFLEAFARGDDVHAATAGEMFGRKPADVTRDQRRAAKAVNFGIVYGMSAYGLARELKCDPGTAREYLDRYFKIHPPVKTYWDATLAQAREKGYVATMFGRRRYLPEIASTNRARREEAEREALNHPIQGAAADVMKLAMVRVEEAVPDASLLLSIHDELLCEVPRKKVAQVAARVREEMEGVHRFDVPLKVETAVGSSWAECHA
jgi:DNA polymerase-1